jgi:DtxR family transcriptional regulator, Mn-dependent transcriptional regulator
MISSLSEVAVSGQASAGARYSSVIEDYVRAIYHLQTAADSVATTVLAAQMQSRAATTTEMVQRLAGLGLVDYARYKGVTLTEAGVALALDVLRRHRLLELFLVTTLHYSWDEVHTEADALEHIVSDQFIARLDAYLGRPCHDPHGAPIPRADGTLPMLAGQPLTELPLNQPAVVVRVAEQQPMHLRYLANLGLVLNTSVVIRQRAPFDGPLVLALDARTFPLDFRLAQAIWVEPLSSDYSSALMVEEVEDV